MKKTAILGLCAVLLGCSQTPVNEEENFQVTQPIPLMHNTAAMPCSCTPENPCEQKPEPMVLKPRVRVLVPHYQTRPCCDDRPWMEDMPTYAIPDAPEIYVISANRTVNSMLKEAEAFYEQIGPMQVFVDAAEIKADDLPGGVEQGTNTLKKRFANIENVTLKDKADKADYVVSSRVDWFDTATKTVPAIKYDLFLKDKNGRLIGEWSEIIHQAEGDRSWW